MLFVSTVALGAEPEGTLKKSDCLKAQPSPKTQLAVLPQGREAAVAGQSIEVDVVDEEGPIVVCSDLSQPLVSADGGTRRLAVALGYGLAVLLTADVTSLQPVPSDAGGWKQLRRRVWLDAQQVGCLKKLPVGTVLYDSPDGLEVGRVVDASIPFGRWDFRQTKSSGCGSRTSSATGARSEGLRRSRGGGGRVGRRRAPPLPREHRPPYGRNAPGAGAGPVDAPARATRRSCRGWPDAFTSTRWTCAAMGRASTGRAGTPSPAALWI
ncbi:MAG: hypothetical protein AMXMBFR34_18650 [Myxococcaceae bacterium]